MKATIDGNRYNTARCEQLGETDFHNYSGNYSGSARLVLASNGVVLVWIDSNGQDLQLQDSLHLFSESEYTIDDFNMTDEETEKCASLGLLKIID